MSKLIKVTTEGDCEGKSVRTVGLFYGEDKQIAEHLMLTDAYKGYDWRFQEQEVTDLTGYVPQFVDYVRRDKYGNINIALLPNKREEMNQAQARAKALAKLTPEERKILGL